MLASARFNFKTLAERDEYMLNKKILCYGTQNKIKVAVPLNTLLFVVEMNNEENHVVGIGLIRNMISPDTHNIYTDPNYHRYVYTGSYRVTREQMEEFDKEMVDIFDLILFKGYTHIKRHSGITIIPPKLLEDRRTNGMNLTEKVKEMFISLFKI